MRMLSTVDAMATLLTIGSTVAQDAPSFEEVLEGARQEGKLTALIYIPAKPETHRALIEAFNERFGLNTEVEWTPTHPVVSVQRVITEAAAGDVSVDVLFGSPQEVQVALQAGVVSPYPWSTVFGDEMPKVRDVEETLFGADKIITLRSFAGVWGIAWNPNLIADGDVPNNYTDFANPDWSGKFSFNSFFAPHDALVDLIGYKGTIDLAKRIIENKPIFARGAAAVAQDVSNGVATFGWTFAHEAAVAAKLGQPIQFKLAADYIPVVYGQVIVPDDAPHPNTARLFAAWLAAEGYKISEQFEQISAPADPESAATKMIEEAVARGAQISTLRSEQDIALSAEARTEITSMLTDVQ